jgi:pyridoxal phosphate enzyme (YggS family)
MSERERVLANLAAVRAGIARAAERSGRDAAAVTIVAATKLVPVEPIRWVVDAGVTALGENYVQELRAKRRKVDGARWHYIGTLRSGSATQVADAADVVQTVAGERAARRLAGRAARAGRTLDALLEVDFTGERSGVAPDDAPTFADVVATLDGLRLVGVMTIPPFADDPEVSRRWFAELREVRERVAERHPGVLETSMGMSLDYEVAVEEGATMVRIGTALFGPRPAGGA